MIKALHIVLAATLFLQYADRPAFATADRDDAKATIGIQAIKITPSAEEAAKRAGADKRLALHRIADSMGEQLIDRVHNTRKFAVVSRSDLGTILKEQDLQRVLSHPNDAHIAQAFRVAGCKYALVVTIDHFKDVEEELRATNGQPLARKRTVSLSSVAKIYNATTGVLLESASFHLSRQDGKKVQPGTVRDGERSDALLIELAREMSARIVIRLLDVIFPARIIAMTGDLVTINRGDGTGIARDQFWSVYATGDDLVDPDTGEALGAEEVLIGKVRVVNVTPKFSQARVLEDFGVDTGQVLRIDQDSLPGLN